MTFFVKLANVKVMRTVDVSAVKQAVKQGFLEICTKIDPEVLSAIKASRETESDDATKFVLDVMLKNAEIAETENCPVCQDTGMAVVFLTVGQDVRITGGSLSDAIQEGVREAYGEGYFRKSVLSPLARRNTRDNTPAILHTEFVDGEAFTLKLMAKGFGSENMSRLYMLPPSAGVEGVKDAIVKTVKDAGANPCPPVVLGVGIGGTMEKAALMSKLALFRKPNSQNEDPILDEIEKDTLKRINDLRIGALGLGGQLTAIGVNCLSYPTHLAGLPVAVTVQCHCSRHKEIVL